jgi:ethanolamine permease
VQQPLWLASCNTITKARNPSGHQEQQQVNPCQAIIPPARRSSSVDFEKVNSEYFQQRELKKGAAGWVLLVGLGVAYVISGDYAGWNFGLAQGGWGGMFLATLLMATMYLCMCFSLAELSSMIPTAGGGYGFARSAFGPGAASSPARRS